MSHTGRPPLSDVTSSTARREIFADVLVDAPRATRAEVTGTTVAAQIDVEDVVPAAARAFTRLRDGRCQA